MFDLKDKVIVVTGAAQGNGEAIAKGLAELGATLVITDINVDKLNIVKEQILETNSKVYAYALNVSNLAECQSLATQIQQDIGQVDVLVNNAGILRRGGFESQDVFQDLDDTININVKGTFYLSHALLEMLKTSQGSIVNVASIQTFVASPTATAYAISKGGVGQLTKTLAVELAKYGIRVNAIAPGIISTAMSQVTRDNEDVLKAFLQHVPLKRTGEPSELVGPVAFLASTVSSYVTGCILPVDGGYLTV